METRAPSIEVAMEFGIEKEVKHVGARPIMISCFSPTLIPESLKN